jgi:hypothetical protein
MSICIPPGKRILSAHRERDGGNQDQTEAKFLE